MELTEKEKKILDKIKRINIKFKKWVGNPIEDTYGSKEVLDAEGVPLFAELAYLKYLREKGWEGFWIDSYRRKFRNKMPSEQPEGTKIPDDKIKLLTKLWEKTGKFKGTWDILAWKGDKILFAELKRVRKDKIRDNQIKFYQVAFESGFNKENFIIIEWELE